MSFTKFALRLTCAILAVAVSGNAAATSYGTLGPHDPARACIEIETAIAEMTGQRTRDGLWPIVYSENFGTVDYGEQAAFVERMTVSEGRPDKSPIQLTTVWPVGTRQGKKSRALYVVGLQRDQWRNERESLFDPMQTEPEGFELMPSYWLVEFSENRIVTMREGFIFFDFVDYEKRLKGCGRDGH